MEPQSHEWLHGFAIAVWLHLAHQSFMKSMHNPYGPTIKRSQCYGSTKPCMTSWLRHRGLASFATPIVYQNQYIGVTIKRTQCYGAIGTSVAPWLRHLGLPSFGTPIVYDINAPPLWIDHKARTMLWSPQTLTSPMVSPPWSGFMRRTDHPRSDITTLMGRP